MKNTVILHAGAPKTGTTSLQFLLRDHDAELRQQQVINLPRWVRSRNIHPVHTAFLRLRREELRTKAIEEGQAALGCEFERYPGYKMLISNESVFGEPFYDGEKGFFPRAEAYMQAVAEMLASFEVQVCLTVRSTGTLVRSYYVQAVRKGYSGNFDDFYASHVPDSPSWLPLVQRMKAIFPHVSIGDYETVQIEPDAALSALFGGAVDLPWSAMQHSYSKNRSAGGNAVTLMRRANALLDRLYADESQQARRQAQRRLRDRLFTMLEYIPGGEPVRAGHPLLVGLDAQYEAERAAVLACDEAP